MEENQIQQSQNAQNVQNMQNAQSTSTEPFNDNSASATNNASGNNFAAKTTGQSSDPVQNLILGKFKSVEELSKAYVELQKHQGESSKELGELRKNSQVFENLQQGWKELENLKNDMASYLNECRTKYDKPEYFQDEAFRKMYKEAFLALGKNLDTDKFVELLEGYVNSRISAYDKSNSAKQETNKVLDSLFHQENTKTTFAAPKKKFDEMTQKEIDEMLERLI